MKIGLLGGTFNPAHEGHAHVARTALKRLQLDYVWWIPARGNPLKTTQTGFDKRYASARSFATGPRMRVTDVEYRLGINYTIDLIRYLKRVAPTAHFVWLMGGDNLLTFHRWGGWTDIADLVPIAVIARPGAGPRARFSKFARRYAYARMPDRAAPLLARKQAPAWAHLRTPLNHESSTRIRTSNGSSA